MIVLYDMLISYYIQYCNISDMLRLLVRTHLCCRYVNVVERRLTVTVLHLNTILSRKIFLKKYFTQKNILFKSIKYLLFLVGWRSRSVGCQGTIHWYFLWLRAEGEFTVIIFPGLITTLQCLHLYSRDLEQWWSSHTNKVLQLLASLNCPET